MLLLLLCLLFFFFFFLWTFLQVTTSNQIQTKHNKTATMVRVITWAECGLPVASPILDACTVTKTGMVYTSGSVGSDVNGNVPESVEEQTEIAIMNLETVLKAAGSSLNSVVKALVFVTDPALVPKVNSVYAKYFTTKPSRSCVITKLAAPQFLVEIEVVAEVE